MKELDTLASEVKTAAAELTGTDRKFYGSDALRKLVELTAELAARVKALEAGATTGGK